MKKYLEIEYPKVNLEYVYLFCRYISDRYFRRKGRFLDLGAGMGDHFHCFQMQGYDGDAVDYFGGKIECDSNVYDTVFTKSTIEHIWDTETMLNEVYRILMSVPGISSRLVCLTPDWTRQVKCFWDDPTHVKPFTKEGLRKALLMAGFKDVTCEYFYQFPFLWRHPRLRWLTYLANLLPPSKKVFIFHSKRRMILATGIKGS